MDSSARRSSTTIVLLIIILLMGVEIIYLVRQNRQLRTVAAEQSTLQIMQQGQSVPPLRALDLDGRAVELDFDGKTSTILVWFSPSCHVCKENVSFWNDIFNRFQNDRVRFLALSDAEQTETKAYAAENNLTLPVIIMTDSDLIEAYNGHIMPQTALISCQGRIEKVWPGALEKSRQDEIIAALDSLSR